MLIDIHRIEMETHIEFVPSSESFRVLVIDIECLSHRHAVIMGKDVFIEPLKYFVVSVFIDVMLLPDDQLAFIAIEEILFPNLIDDIASKSIDSAGEPKTKDPLHFHHHIWVMPIEIDLFFVEKMEIPFTDIFIEFPSAAAKIALPIVRWLGVVVLAFFPVVIIVEGRIDVFRLLEPWVLIARMIDDEIHHDPDASFTGLDDEAIHIGEGSEFRVNLIVIADVVAKIDIGAFINRGEPNDANAQVLKIIELGDNAWYIADAIPIRIAKAPRINLINDVRPEKPIVHKQKEVSHISPYNDKET